MSAETADVRQEKTVRLYLLAHIQKGGVIVEDEERRVIVGSWHMMTRSWMSCFQGKRIFVSQKPLPSKTQ